AYFWTLGALGCANTRLCRQLLTDCSAVLRQNAAVERHARGLRVGCVSPGLECGFLLLRGGVWRRFRKVPYLPGGQRGRIGDGRLGLRQTAAKSPQRSSTVWPPRKRG